TPADTFQDINWSAVTPNYLVGSSIDMNGVSVPDGVNTPQIVTPGTYAIWGSIQFNGPLTGFSASDPTGIAYLNFNVNQGDSAAGLLPALFSRYWYAYAA